MERIFIDRITTKGIITTLANGQHSLFVSGVKENPVLIAHYDIKKMELYLNGDEWKKHTKEFRTFINWWTQFSFDDKKQFSKEIEYCSQKGNIKIIKA